MLCPALARAYTQRSRPKIGKLSDCRNRPPSSAVRACESHGGRRVDDLLTGGYFVRALQPQGRQDQMRRPPGTLAFSRHVVRRGDQFSLWKIRRLHISPMLVGHAKNRFDGRESSQKRRGGGVSVTEIVAAHPARAAAQTPSAPVDQIYHARLRRLRLARETMTDEAPQRADDLPAYKSYSRNRTFAIDVW